MIIKLKSGFNIRGAVLVPVLSIMLCSCIDDYSKPKDIIDPNGNLNRQDYEDILPQGNPKQKKHNQANQDSSNVPAIPEASEILTAPKQPEAGPDKLVSISVTEDVPLKDVLVELGRLADVDMEIDPGITGGIIMKATNRPFNEVIKRVADLGNLKYETKNGVIKIERDTPYLVNYVTDFLNIVRSNTSTMSIGGGSSSGSASGSSSSSSGSSGSSGGTGSSGSSSSGSSSGGVSSGSSDSITSSYDGDLWKSVEATMKDMIGTSATVETPTATETTSGSTTGSSVSTTSTPATTGLTINKQAGIISAVATQKQHKDIEAYLSSVKKSVSSQVLIEAKIVEVTLDKQFASGIDWGVLSDTKVGLKISGSFKGGITGGTDVFTIAPAANTNGSLGSVVSMLEKFGTSRTLSSPRLHAMNNQQSVLSFAENNVYFTLEVKLDTAAATAGTTAATTTTIASTPHTVPIGVILTLQPSINLETNEVTMNIRPTLSRITSTVSDPGVDLNIAQLKAQSADPTQFANVSSKLPIIEVRELDSVLKVKSGDIMVIGGLMKDVSTNTDTGIPGLERLPYFGNAFKSVVKTNQTVETVIFIKATIVPSDGVVDKADKSLYKKFMRDPRPLAF